MIPEIKEVKEVVNDYPYTTALIVYDPNSGIKNCFSVLLINHRRNDGTIEVLGRELKLEHSRKIARFHKVFRKLENETAFMSYTSASHPRMVELIKLGKPIVPLLLGNLNWWAFTALREIIGTSPKIKEEDRGILDKIKEAWLVWAEENGYRYCIHNVSLHDGCKACNVEDIE